MDYKEIYNQWLENPYFDEATKEELKAIKDDENEIKERFLIRAVKTGKKKSRDSFSDTMKALHVAPTLDRLLYPEESASQKGE